MKKVIAVLAVAVTSAVVLFSVSVAGAVPPVGQLCPAGDSGKIDTPSNPTTLTIYAPDGFLINGYCVKAGSANQACGGAVFVAVDPPAASVEISYPWCGGKGISHYSVTYEKKEPPPCDPKVDPKCDPV